jgi:hypothetical protein
MQITNSVNLLRLAKRLVMCCSAGALTSSSMTPGATHNPQQQLVFFDEVRWDVLATMLLLGCHHDHHDDAQTATWPHSYPLDFIKNNQTHR